MASRPEQIFGRGTVLPQASVCADQANLLIQRAFYAGIAYKAYEGVKRAWEIEVLPHADLDEAVEAWDQAMRLVFEVIAEVNGSGTQA